MHKGLLYGHSFVYGLQQHLEHIGVCTPSEVAKHLKVNDHIEALHLFGERGLGMQAHNFAVPHELLLELCPDFVILNIGGNDLAQGTSPLVVASAVVQLGEGLVRDYAVRDVIICSAIPRTGHLHGITPDLYTANTAQFNKCLRHFCDVDPTLHYHTHRGFWNNDITMWSHDGCHPNTPAGRRKYKQSIRLAVHRQLARTTCSGAQWTKSRLANK